MYENYLDNLGDDRDIFMIVALMTTMMMACITANTIGGW